MYNTRKKFHKNILHTDITKISNFSILFHSFEKSQIHFFLPKKSLTSKICIN